mmetsp:Transcript_10666/g.16332  ORF Transcript_10666/g.16332 Transcript_10666/m.16332 type:complete len:891 (+) Transcript_10666:37-2709(+)
MEAFVDTSFEFDGPGLNCSYDRNNDNFLPGGGVPVREVKDKKIPSHENGCIVKNKFDTFSGIIDGVSGEPLRGVRHYSLTDEIYEGKFQFNGLRHGEEAIVKNIVLPAPRDVIPDFPDLLCDIPEKKSSHVKANFFGTYLHDKPSFGNLVTESFIYRGPFLNGYFHGGKGELIHPNGYKYIGDFEEGLFQGMGREIDPDRGEYQGEFRNGMKHGIGTLKEIVPEETDNKAENEEEASECYESVNLKETEGMYDEKSDGSKSTELLLDDVRQKIEDAFKFQEDTSERDATLHASSNDKYVYSGRFHYNQRQGEGTEWTPGPNGEVFCGEFVADRRHGHGSLTLRSTGAIFEGKWRAGKAVVGNGWRVLYANGDIYCGHVEDLQPHGYGIHQDSSGLIYVGYWKHGERCGNGIRSNGNNTEFAGQWEKEEKVSVKRLEEADKTLGEIADALQIRKSNEELDELQQAGDVTKEGDEVAEESQKDINSDVIKEKAMFNPDTKKSIEKSLQMIVSKASCGNTEEFESFSDSAPQTLNKSRAHRVSTDSDEEVTSAEVHCYANRDTYLGGLDPKNLQRTGYGVYVSKTTGCSYTGSFKNNKRDGFGILIHSQFGKYAGNFREDKKHGEGTLILSDNSSYHGNFANGTFDGKGTLCEQEGNVYVGEWRNGLRHGDGMETMNDGRVYKGTFKNGKREGKGTLLEKSAGKIIYRGKWKENMYHGEGVLIKRIRPVASLQIKVIRWEGEFVSGQKHGYGILINESEKSQWKGMWNNDKPESGKWRIHYSDGGVYSGQATVSDGYVPKDKVSAMPEGFGTFQYSNGDVYVGNFQYGLRSGRGSCKFASGEQWEGCWTKDQLDKRGGGILTLANGEVHKFENPLKSFFWKSNKHDTLITDSI